MINILIIRLSSLGDILHTYPMIYDIKSNVEKCQIDWLVDESFAEILQINNNVDKIITVPLRKWKKSKNKVLVIKEIYNWYKKNATQKKYDYIVDSQGLIKSSLLSIFFKGKVYGFDKTCVREKLATIFYNYKYKIPNQYISHTKNRLLAQSIFNYPINLNQINFGINYISHDLDISHLKKPYVIFFHATSRTEKEYPIPYWVELANYLIKNYNLGIVLPFGSSREYENSKLISHQINSTNVFIPDKVYSYLKISSLIANSYFIFGVDTGLVHLANTLNKKIIAIYTDTNPQNTGIIESQNAKNLGAKGVIPTIQEVIDVFEDIKGL